MNEALAQLEQADLTVEGQVVNASNLTLLVSAGSGDDGVHAIYKPRAGERPLWDFPRGTLCQRETAAWQVSETLGWDIVPPTVLRDGPMGIGSVQLFVPHSPRDHYFNLVEDPDYTVDLARMAAFDLLINNADRKGSHVLLGPDGRIRGIDHGVAFHVQTKLRTVIWDLGGTPLESGWHSDLDRLCTQISQCDGVWRNLSQLLSEQELRMLVRRAGLLRRSGALPDVDTHRRPYPWPLL